VPEKQHYDFGFLDSEELDRLERDMLAQGSEPTKPSLPNSEDVQKLSEEYSSTIAHDKTQFAKGGLPPLAAPTANLDSNNIHLNLFFHMYPANDYVL
jgi:hypothetical protein